MQKLIRSLFIVILITGSLLAQKNFTLEQVTLESKSLSPKRLLQLQWIPGTDEFTYLETIEEETNLVKEKSDTEGKEIILTLSKLNVTIQSAELNTLNFSCFQMDIRQQNTLLELSISCRI